MLEMGLGLVGVKEGKCGAKTFAEVESDIYRTVYISHGAFIAGC